ncbi:MAG: hypothetical protein ACFFBP_01315 [Promethearchaeota archaeon]
MKKSDSFPGLSEKIYDILEFNPDPEIKVGAVVILNDKQEILYSTSRDPEMLKYLDFDIEFARGDPCFIGEIVKFFDDSDVYVCFHYLGNQYTLVIIILEGKLPSKRYSKYFWDLHEKLKKLLID